MASKSTILLDNLTLTTDAIKVKDNKITESNNSRVEKIVENMLSLLLFCLNAWRLII